MIAAVVCFAGMLVAAVAHELKARKGQVVAVLRSRAPGPPGSGARRMG
jgi:hypothetical protein